MSVENLPVFSLEVGGGCIFLKDDFLAVVVVLLTKFCLSCYF